MKIWDEIKHPFEEKVEEYKAKQKQKKLIKTDDDKLVIESLPADQNNLAIDIQQVVKNMGNPENMAEVVANNLEEIIEQDNVKDTLKYLHDNDILRILQQNNKQLKNNKKIKRAIDAITHNDQKIQALSENLRDLSDFELAKILNSLQSEEDVERKRQLENQKIKLVGMKILEHMITHGGAWHIEELTECLDEKSKLSVAKLCLRTIDGYEKNKKKNISSDSKMKLIMKLFQVANLNYEQKMETLDLYVGNGLNSEEVKMMKNKMELERLQKEDEQLKKEEKLRNERLKRTTGEEK